MASPQPHLLTSPSLWWTFPPFRFSTSLWVHHYFHHEAVSQASVLSWHYALCEEEMEATSHAPFSTLLPLRQDYWWALQTGLHLLGAPAHATFPFAASIYLQTLLPSRLAPQLQLERDSILYEQTKAKCATSASLWISSGCLCQAQTEVFKLNAVFPYIMLSIC